MLEKKYLNNVCYYACPTTRATYTYRDLQNTLVHYIFLLYEISSNYVVCVQ